MALSAMYVWLLGKIEPFHLVRYASRQKTAAWAGHCVLFKYNFHRWIYWSNMGAVNLVIFVPKFSFPLLVRKMVSVTNKWSPLEKSDNLLILLCFNTCLSVSLTSLGCDLNELTLLLFWFYLFFILSPVTKRVFSTTK